MKHLGWNDIFQAMETGRTPEHLDRCGACRARWERAKGMFESFRPDDAPDRSNEILVQRILASAPKRSAASFFSMRWALAGALLLMLGGSAVFWQSGRTDTNRQFASVFDSDIADNPAGLDAILPSSYFSLKGTFISDIPAFTEETN